MSNSKYQGIFPAFYACYDENNEVSIARTKALTQYFIEKGVAGVYVCGSSGECIYQSIEDRKKTLEAVVNTAKGELIIIAHVACNNTKDSVELAKHAQSLGVDAVAAIPPIYFHLPEHSITDYWNAISDAAPDTDFIIYNIPQLAGTSLTASLLSSMLKNPKVIGVKNSSMAAQDIQLFKTLGGPDFTVFNGPDEQLISGLAIGAGAGIGGTYGVMPELYLKLYELFKQKNMKEACELQYSINAIIAKLCSGYGNMYAMIKEILRINAAIDLGDVRSPLTGLSKADLSIAAETAEQIQDTIAKYY